MKAKVLEYKGYQGSVEFSLEDGVLYGKILHIVDLVTYEAEALLGLKEAFEESVDDYLESCVEEGVNPDKPYSGTFNVRLGADLHRQLALAASREELTLNETVKRVLETWLTDCPQGFEVLHRHEHHMVPPDLENVYTGSVPLTTRQPAPALRLV